MGLGLFMQFAMAADKPGNSADGLFCLARLQKSCGLICLRVKGRKQQFWVFEDLRSAEEIFRRAICGCTMDPLLSKELRQTSRGMRGAGGSRKQALAASFYHHHPPVHLRFTTMC